MTPEELRKQIRALPRYVVVTQSDEGVLDSALDQPPINVHEAVKLVDVLALIETGQG